MRVTEITCKRLVTPTGGYLHGFTHTINPYHGCSLGRSLCGLPDYAPGIIASWGEKRTWGDYLDVKVNAGEAYERDYDRIRKRSDASLRIFMSSVTDPYVPQEKRYRVTAGILSRMRERPPDLLALQTHTPNPLWDIDLIAGLSRRFPVSVQITVETDRETMGPQFPPHAYPVARRIEALRKLRDRGVQTVGVVSPLWPIDDLEGFARRLDEACRYVVIDHFLLGDGSRDGVRTRRRLVMAGRTFPQLLEEAGFGEWTTIAALHRALAVFRRVLGEERVGVSREGFLEAAHRLLK